MKNVYVILFVLVTTTWTICSYGQKPIMPEVSGDTELTNNFSIKVDNPANVGEKDSIFIEKMSKGENWREVKANPTDKPPVYNKRNKVVATTVRTSPSPVESKSVIIIISLIAGVVVVVWILTKRKRERKLENRDPGDCPNCDHGFLEPNMLAVEVRFTEPIILKNGREIKTIQVCAVCLFSDKILNEIVTTKNLRRMYDCTEEEADRVYSFVEKYRIDHYK
jgi:hypothetical protein